MADLHFISNTTKNYPCVHCGGQGNIIREASTLEDTRLKCLTCNGLYNAKDSLEADQAGVIPDGPQTLQDQSPSRSDHQTRSERPAKEDKPRSEVHIPRTPTYVFVSKDRTRSEFISKGDLRNAVLRWEYEKIKFDAFELQPKSVTAIIELR